MPDRRNREKKDNRRSSEDIQVPPISKQTAGAVTGAAIGSVAGPLGAVVGGVVGAIAGKVAVGRRPVRKGIKRVQEFPNAGVSRDLRGKSPALSRAKQARGHVAKLRRESLCRRQKQVRANERDGRRAQRPRHHSSGRDRNVNVARRELLEDNCRQSQETLLERGLGLSR